MTGSEKLDAEEQREKIFAANNYRCVVCRGPVRQHGTAQLAHRIAQTKTNLAKYGAAIIHHPLNLVPVCQLRCNDKCNIGHNPGKVKELVTRILEALKKEHG